MCILCNCKGDYSELQGMYILDCSDCIFITKIPIIQGIKELLCYRCTSLTQIPNLKGLEKLDCSYCTSLTEIPNIQGLKELICHGCISITEIPNIQGLERLYCSHCIQITEMPNIQKLQMFYCYGCKWLEYNNYNYSYNIKKLKIIQKWFRCCILSNKLKHMIRPITEIYYHPEMKGGFLHKKAMMSFIGSI